MRLLGTGGWSGSAAREARLRGRGGHARRGNAAAAAAVAFAALLAAGCGAGAGPANAGHGAATSSSSAATPGAGGSGGPGSSGTQAFSACMRSHGIADFPDMTSGRMMMSVKNGAVAVNGVPLKESASQFQAAQQACQQDLQAPSATSAASAQMQQKADAYSACMRSHGMTNFPDLKVSKGGNFVHVELPPGINPNSPQFQAAQQACQSLMPGPGGAAGGTPAGG